MPTQSSLISKSQLKTEVSTITVAKREYKEPIDVIVQWPEHSVQLELLSTSHEGRACFSDRWARSRFEPLGPAFFIPASQSIHFKSDCRQVANITCNFTPGAIERWFDGELEWTDSRLIGSLDIRHSTIRNLLVRLYDEISMPGFASDTLAELISAEIAIELSRYHLGAEEHWTTGGLAPWRMRLIDERLAEPGARASLSELAHLCNMSSRQLTRAFRTTRGCSIGGYITQSRIEQAKRLLSGDKNMKTIAHDLGFNSPSHFHTAFRQLTGETPGEYRLRLHRGACPQGGKGRRQPTH